MPVQKPTMPIAQSVIGEVRNTDDPQGIGRVQVDFKFARQYNKIWLRVMSPNAGSSKAVSKNRGMMFIPEVEDQVMINFEYGDPNRPYVAGSMWHSGNSSGGGVKNHVKSIITRSGIKIVLDDTQESVHIEDPSGNTWNMDGQGNISVNAPKNITINAGGSIDISAGENISVDAGRDIATSAGQDFSTNAGQNISESAGGDIMQSASGDIVEMADNKTVAVEETSQRTSQKTLSQADKMTVYSTDDDLLLQSEKSAKINSAERSDLF
jgi:uncharacterized protein involved in type VI secretion and phage assembly